MMNNEEIERKMNFIVEQQAQFASDIQQLQESQARTEQIVAQNGEAVTHLVEAVGQTAETVVQVGDVVTRLANVTHAGFTEMHAGFTEVNAKINALVDAQIRTEENLTNFISEVDRRFREDRNGK
jgi:uncharacterized phage infection (PIP) family protein YhgE